jgi:hypothetical protein
MTLIGDLAPKKSSVLWSGNEGTHREIEQRKQDNDETKK